MSTGTDRSALTANTQKGNEATYTMNLKDQSPWNFTSDIWREQFKAQKNLGIARDIYGKF